MSELLPIDTMIPIILTQSGDASMGPSAPGQQTTTTQVADGSKPVSEGGQSTSSDPFGGNFLVIMMLLFGAMIMFTFFGNRKQKKKRSIMLDSLQKHDQVLTRGGVFGSIVEVKSDRVVLKVDESSNTRITVLRESIEQVTADTVGN